MATTRTDREHLLAQGIRAASRKCGRFEDFAEWGPGPAGEITALRDAVRFLAPNLYAQDAGKALRSVLQHAFRRVRHEPIPSRRVTGTYFDVGERLLGLELLRNERAARNANPNAKDYDLVTWEVLQELTNGAAHNGEHLREVTAPFRQMLAVAILDRVDAGRARNASQQRPPTPVLHVRRTVMQEALAAALRATDSRAVCVWGGSGDGKTALVMETLRSEVPDGDVIYIDFSHSWQDVDADHVSRQIRSVLADRNQPAAEQSPLWTLKRLLAEPDCADAVVLDDLSPVLAAEILPIVNAPVVVSISRRPLPRSLGQPFHITPFAESEARELVASSLPGTEPEARDRLCRRLGFRPLPLVLACTLITNTSTTLESLLDAMAYDSADTLDRVQRDLDRPHDRAVTTVYKLALEELAASDEVATRLLSVICWVSGSGTTEKIRLVAQFLRLDIHQYQFESALRELHRSSLITLDDDSFAINLLTLDILRLLTREQISFILRPIMEEVREAVRRARAALNDAGGLMATSNHLSELSTSNMFHAALYSDAFSCGLYLGRINSSERGAARLGTSTWIIWDTWQQESEPAAEDVWDDAFAVVSLEFLPDVDHWLVHSGAKTALEGPDGERLLSLIRAWHYAEHDFLALFSITTGAEYVVSRPRPFIQPSFIEVPNRPRHAITMPYASPLVANERLIPLYSACGMLVQYEDLEPPEADCGLCLAMGSDDWKSQRQAFEDLVNCWDVTVTADAARVVGHYIEIVQDLSLKVSLCEEWVELAGATPSDLTVRAYTLAALRYLHSIRVAASDLHWPPTGVKEIEDQALSVIGTVAESDDGDAPVGAIDVWYESMVTSESFSQDYRQAESEYGHTDAVGPAEEWGRRHREALEALMGLPPE